MKAMICAGIIVGIGLGSIHSVPAEVGIVATGLVLCTAAFLVLVLVAHVTTPPSQRPSQAIRQDVWMGGRGHGFAPMEHEQRLPIGHDGGEHHYALYGNGGHVYGGSGRPEIRRRITRGGPQPRVQYAQLTVYDVEVPLES